jgi:putative transposase
MLLAHKVQLYPTAEQAEYLRRCMGARRFTYNELLEHFRKPGIKWSKKAAYAHFIAHVRQPWMAELSSRAPRNAIDDLDNAFQHFFRRCKERKNGEKPGFPQWHRKGVHDSFALREKPKFDVCGRRLRIEKAPGRIKMQQALRWSDEKDVLCSVTISERAGKFFAAVLVDTQNYGACAGDGSVGVDFGVHSLAVLSTGEKIPANQKLKANLRRLRRRSRVLARKQRGSNRRARAKLAVAKLHKRVADQRSAVLHEVSDLLTRRFDRIVIEDLAVKNMVKNRRLARSISDAGFGTFRRMLEYKAVLRGNTIIVAPRFFPSSKTCSCCGVIKDELSLNKRTFRCDECGFECDRDLNAALNLLHLDTFRPGTNAHNSRCQTSGLPDAAALDGVPKSREMDFIGF